MASVAISVASQRPQASDDRRIGAASVTSSVPSPSAPAIAHAAMEMPRMSSSSGYMLE